MAPKPEKSESGSISCKHGTEGLHGKNNWSVPTFFRSGRIFSCSVNGAVIVHKRTKRVQIFHDIVQLVFCTLG